MPIAHEGCQACADTVVGESFERPVMSEWQVAYYLLAEDAGQRERLLRGMRDSARRWSRAWKGVAVGRRILARSWYEASEEQHTRAAAADASAGRFEFRRNEMKARLHRAGLKVAEQVYRAEAAEGERDALRDRVGRLEKVVKAAKGGRSAGPSITGAGWEPVHVDRQGLYDLFGEDAVKQIEEDSRRAAEPPKEDNL